MGLPQLDINKPPFSRFWWSIVSAICSFWSGGTAGTSPNFLLHLDCLRSAPSVESALKSHLAIPDQENSKPISPELQSKWRLLQSPHGMHRQLVLQTNIFPKSVRRKDDWRMFLDDWRYFGMCQHCVPLKWDCWHMSIQKTMNYAAPGVKSRPPLRGSSGYHWRITGSPIPPRPWDLGFTPSFSSPWPKAGAPHANLRSWPMGGLFWLKHDGTGKAGPGKNPSRGWIFSWGKSGTQGQQHSCVKLWQWISNDINETNIESRHLHQWHPVCCPFCSTPRDGSLAPPSSTKRWNTREASS